MDDLPGFRTLSPSERARVKAASAVQRVRRGGVLFLEGQPAAAVWAVQEGLIHIVKAGPGGREIILDVIPPGEYFGAVATLEGRPYPATALAAAPSVVTSLPGALARDLCQRHPTLRAAILAQLSGRLRRAHERLQSMALEPVERRLARILLVLTNKIGRQKDGLTALSVTRQELGDMIGATVETVIRITSKWQRSRIVRSSRHEIDLADLDALRAIAAGRTLAGAD